MQKNILIIAYYWPPAGGPGVQRWLKFVKYLPEFDVNPIVCVPENANFPLLDESLVDEIPKGLEVIKRPIKEPYGLAGLFSSKKTKTISKGIISEDKKQSFVEKLLLFIRGNFFIPDARIGWINPSVKFLTDYLNQHQVDAIITTGPPHSVHLIGLGLKKRLGIHWIADFRDPWTTIGYHKELKLTKASAEKHLRLEKEVLNSADRVIVTSSVTKREFEAKTSKPISVITNGYDVEKVGEINRDSKFSLAHIGSLLSKRNPEILWRVLSDLRKEDVSFSTDLEINLVGAVSNDVIQTLKSYGLMDCLNEFGYVNHSEAIKYQRQSQVLLLLEIDSKDHQHIIPGKLFEYMASHRPILALGPKGSDVEGILKYTNTGAYFLYNDYDALKLKVLEYYHAFKKGELETYPIGVQKYSRRALTKDLVNIMPWV